KLDLAVILFYTLFFAVFAGLFAISYFCRSIVTLGVFNLGMIVWICVILHLFGWNIGVQHFLMVLLVLFFFSSYKQYTKKIIYAVFLCAFRILLFYIYRYREPLWSLAAADENALQIINTITIFWCLSVVVFIFSNNSQELERKLMDYNMQLEELANTDALTGLNNRRKALDYMGILVKRSAEYGAFSICICDIDFFKKVNDTYGHDFGDEVLKGISKVFNKELKGKDFAARWGGEEFLLLFPDCNGDDAFLKVSHLRNKIKEMKVKKDETEVGVTMTFGLTEYDFNSDLSAAIKEADEKLYLGKEQGRDRIVY
ncbi:MAG: diguanylate cyclase, partial [Lachnospiraceae bacterium]|nr:diguanylate cyclase [Lachnospiraceae bacterium]